MKTTIEIEYDYNLQPFIDFLKTQKLKIIETKSTITPYLYFREEEICYYHDIKIAGKYHG